MITADPGRWVGELLGTPQYTALGSGFRFPGITIPSGSTITSSYITFYAGETTTSTSVMSKITGNKQDNPAAFSTIYDFQTRRGTIADGPNNDYITSAQVNWDNIGAWTENSAYNSPEINTIIQELINAHAPDNESLALFWDDFDKRSSGGAYRNAQAYWHSPSQAAQLHIEYSITPPTAPSNVYASDGIYTDKVRITWTASSGATSYKVYRNTSNSSGSASLIGSPTSTSFDDTSAVAGTTYYYWVKAHNDGGDSDFSSPDTGWRAVSVPAAPTNVLATDGTYTNKVRISWTASSGATGYKVFRNTTNNNVTATEVGTDTNSPYYDYTAIVGTTYYYWMKAYNTSGDSDFSDHDTGWRATVSAPSGVSASDGTYSDKIRISWTASSGATSYKVYRHTSNSSGSASLIGSPTSTSYEDTTAVAGTTYYYWIKASCPKGDSCFSDYDIGYRQSHRHWGTQMINNTIKGVWAYQTLFKDYSVPTQHSQLYAPTLKCPNLSPVEATACYYYDPETSSYQRQIAFYDFAYNPAQWFWRIKGNDVDPYVEGGGFFTVFTFWSDVWDCWVTQLYNFSQSTWEYIMFEDNYGDPNNYQDIAGWDGFEEWGYPEDSWAVLDHQFVSYDLKALVNGNWVYVDDTYGSERTDNAMPYNKHFVNDYYYWFVEDNQ
ncbi:MAG: hypothetical protein JXA46_11400 [Dehalococcoidales bacterium]|nr:hypothetical protein [Dehalococcoidales bacterium]